MLEIEKDIRVGHFIFNIPDMPDTCAVLEIERVLKISKNSFCEFRTVKQF